MTWRGRYCLWSSALVTALLSANVARAESALGLEFGGGLALSNVDDEFERAGSGEDEHGGLGLGLGATWQWRLTNRFQLGPRLGTLLHLSGAPYPSVVELDVLGSVRTGLEGPVTAHFVWGVGPAWNNSREVYSFQIEQESDSAFGLHLLLGYRVEYRVKAGAWTLQTLGSLYPSFVHERRMRDSLTGETATTKERAAMLSLLVLYGFTWK